MEWDTAFTVIAQLPPLDDDFQYRIKVLSSLTSVWPWSITFRWLRCTLAQLMGPTKSLTGK